MTATQHDIDNGLDAMVRKAIRAVELILAIVLLVIICLNFINVVGRYVFSRTLLGIDEVQIYGMIWIAFLGAGVVTLRVGQLRMDAFSKLFPSAIAKPLRIVELAVVIVLGAFVVYHSANYTAQMFSVMSAIGGIPMWIPHSAVVVGYALIVLICVRQVWTGGRP